MASNAKDTLIRRIAGTPGKGTGANTGLGTTDIVVPQFPLLPDRLTKETAAQFREEVDRWRAGLQAQFPVPQTVTTTTGGTGTSTGSTAPADSVTKDQLDDAIALVTTRVDNLITQIQNNVTATAITPRTFQIFGKATSDPEVYAGTANVEFNVRTLSVVPTDIALSTGSFIVGSVGEVGVDTQKSDIPISGFGPAASDVSFGGFKITNVSSPTVPQDAANKAYVDSRPPVNIYNTSGTLTGNRTITGNGNSLSITGTSSVSLVSNTSTLLASPTVTFSTGGALNLYLASSTAAGTTSDYILGINPADGQIRYTSTTISSLSNQGTSGLVSGSTGKIAKFTGPNSVGDSIMTQSASMAIVEVAGAMSVTDSYQINGQYIISWNAPYNNAVFGTRPAGWNTVTGYSNTGVGKETLYSITSGQNNSGFGSQALRSNQNGNYNTAVGSAALQYTVSGSDNTAVGALSCIQTTATDNTGVGSRTLVANTTGAANFAGGSLALYSCSTGSFNVSIGYKAGYLLTQGAYNTIVGTRALESITGASSSSNVAIGFNAGNNMTGGSGNIIIGAAAQVPDATGSYQLSIGNLIFGTGLDGANGYISSGNIGIGVKVPTAKLEVDGAIKGLYQRYGSGSPEGVVAAPVGTRYSRTDGGAGTSLYVKESGGTTSSGWVAIKTADGITTSNIYNSNGTLSGNRTLDGGTYSLTFNNLSTISLVSSTGATLNTNSGTLLLKSSLGDVEIYAKNKLYVKTPAVTAGTASASQLLSLSNATTGEAEFITVNPVNIYNTDGTLTGNRIVSGSGYNLTFSSFSSIQSTATNSIAINAPTVNTTASGSVQISSPLITFASGGALNLFFAASTNNGNSNDYILGVNPSNGQIRYTTATTGGFASSSSISGSSGKLAKFTSSNTIGNSIITESASMAIVEVAGSMSVTDSYQINSQYIISWNPAYANAVFGTRPAWWNTVTGYNNTGGGYRAMYSLTSGLNNSGFGNQALMSNQSGTDNTSVGSAALAYSVSASHNTAVGSLSCISTTTATDNTAIGSHALGENTTGGSNFAGGSYSLFRCSTGTLNAAVGNRTGYFIAAGSRNTMVGASALYNLGAGANDNNVAVGYSAGSSLTAGSGNVIIGYNSQAASNTGSNQLSIGNLIYGTGLDGTGNTPSAGNIGIGVQVPSCKLDVDGAVKSKYQRFGSNTPEGLVAAPVGALYSRTDGASGTTLYVKESGADTSSGWVAIKTATGLTSANIYNSDGTLTANRTLLGNNNSLTMSGLASLSLSASGSIGVTSSSAATITGPVTNIVATTSSKITSPTITFDTGETLKPYFSTGTTTGTTSDYILVINAAGQIKRSSSTISGISGGGGSGTVIGTVGRIAKFTAANAVGDSIMAETPDLITVTGSVAVTDGYKVNNDYVVSWNPYSDNAVFGTRPLNWLNTALVGNRNTLCGNSAGYSLDKDCSDNVAVGYKSLYSAVGDNQSGRGCNTAVGSESLSHNTTGFSNAAFGYSSLNGLSSGDNNVAVGSGAMSSVSVANENAVLGASALAVDGDNASDAYNNPIPVNGNVAIGYMAGFNQHGGSANIIIGYKAQVPNSTGSYQLSIGNLIYGTGLDGTNSTMSTGNIGIGVQNPTAKLDVDGGIKGLYLRYGAGDPQAVGVNAPIGAIYSRTDGGAGTSIYIRESNSSWTPVVSGGGGGGGGSGTVLGTSGKIAKFTSADAVGDSIISDSGSVVTVAGAGYVTGNLDVDGAIKGLYVRYGSADPQNPANNVTAPAGTIYSRTSGGSGTSLYVKESGTGNTGWVPVRGTNTVVNTLAELKLLNPTQYTSADTLGYSSVGDGGGASYRWTSDATATNNGAKIASSVSGAWINTSEVVNVRQWGALPSNTTNCGALIIEAIEWAGSQATPPKIVIPAGEYRIETTIIIRKSNIHIDLFGTLKNKDTLPYGVMYIGNSAGLALVANVVPSIGPTYSATGQVTAYPVKNVTIDGHGTGMLDGNCQTVAAWESNSLGATWISTNTRYGSYHGLLAYGVSGFALRNLTVQRPMTWSISIECCENFDVGFVRSFSGFANGRMDMGVKQFLGTQDGIHAHDSKNGFIHDCVVESGDDALAVSAARTTDAGNIVVSRNKAMVKVFTYEADGVTVNTTSKTGRFGMSCFTNAQQYYCDLRNVTFSDNVIQGGQGLFMVEDKNNTSVVPAVTSHSGITSNIKFIGNQFIGQKDAGVAATMDFGWYIDGGNNIELIGNTFDDIARIGRVGGNSGKNGTVVFRGNKFSNWKRGYPYDLWSLTPAIIRMSQGTRLIVEGNTFENNDIIPVAVGSDGDLTPNQFSDVIVNNNVFIGNNLRWTASNLMPATGYSAALFVEAANNVEFNGNTIQTNNGSALFARTCNNVTAKGNKIFDLKGYTTSTAVQTANAFYVGNQPETSGVIVDIQGNTVSNIDGQFFVAYNPGKIFIKNNTINNACNLYSTGYLMTVVLNVSSISNPPITYFGGNIFGNSAYRNSGQSVLYFNTGVSTSGYTGNKLIYSSTLNQWGSNYTAADVQANATGIIATS